MRTGRLAVALTAAAMLALAGCSSGGGSGDESTGESSADVTGGASGTVRIGIKFDQPGLGFQDGDKYTGFDVDVAKYVAGKLGYSEDQIEWV